MFRAHVKPKHLACLKTELITIHRNVLVSVDTLVYKNYYFLFIIFWESQIIEIHLSILKKCFGLGIYGILKNICEVICTVPKYQ